jgi:nitrogen fixation/metabolism regulation signal transduction histidine kinase
MVGLIPLVIFGGLGLLLLAIAFGLWFGATTVEVINRNLHVRSTYIVFFLVKNAQPG